jgi:hypothetical protein
VLSVEADVEPRVGGKYELFRDPEDRENNSTIGCRITATEEGKLLAFEWKGPVQFKGVMNRADPLTHVSVFFLPLRGETEPLTEVHVIHSGWGRSEAWGEARRFFERAWEEALKALCEAVDADG